MEGQVIELAYALDTFYFLVMGAFVMWMAAGFSMLEAGMVSSKSVVEILTKNIALYSIASIMYMIVGYNLMYPADGNGVMPAVSFFLGGDNEAADVIASGGDVYYSALSDFFFQVVFVATAMSIVSGAVAERMKLSSFLLFAIVMTGLIYPVQGYWKWGGGFLDAAGFQDFAGSGVVHLCGAAAALAGVILLGARKGKYEDGKINAIPGSNMPLATLGTFILWLGWFGFNGGSELMVSNVGEANAVSMVFVNTNASAAGGVLGALILGKILFGKFDLSMSLNGAIGGLVSITAEPLAPTPELAAIIGAIGGIIVVLSVIMLDKSKIDDPVGAISAHGTCGVWGLIAVCLSNGDATLGGQLYGAIIIFAWTFIVSGIFWGILKAVMGIRITSEAEEMGVDVSECGMEAYPEFKK
ncbi:MAG: ammonium transporter [Gammaproteobacteria bacterium]|jgi:Amt family ammonium transporter|tara:strand:- start:7421 stop:8659 length:1239 start_codon:yes stop_codon:yes gene_type:complete